MSEITVKNLSKSFGEKKVLSDISFSVKKGSCVRITGESGIGKTTLLRILSGLEKADSGEILGISQKDCAFLFQEDRLFPQLTALENVTLVMKNITEKAKKEKAEELFLQLGLDFKDFSLYPSELSGGMCRRVAIARMLAYDKPIILLDEALRGLDPANAERAARVIEKQSVGKTVFFVTHEEPKTLLDYSEISL